MRRTDVRPAWQRSSVFLLWSVAAAEVNNWRPPVLPSVAATCTAPPGGAASGRPGEGTHGRIRWDRRGEGRALENSTSGRRKNRGGRRRIQGGDTGGVSGGEI